MLHVVFMSLLFSNRLLLLPDLGIYNVNQGKLAFPLGFEFHYVIYSEIEVIWTNA